MLDVPHLPGEGPVRVIALVGSAGLLGFVVASVVTLARKVWSESGWAIAALALAAATFMFGRNRGWHSLLSTMVLAVALRNAVCGRGLARWAWATGALAWTAAIVIARLVFR